MTALSLKTPTLLTRNQTKNYMSDSLDEYVNAHTSNSTIELIVSNYQAAAMDGGFTLHSDALQIVLDYRNRLEMKSRIDHLPSFTEEEKILIADAARRAKMGYLQYVRYATLKAAAKW